MAPLAASAATMALPSPSPTPTPSAKTNGSATGVAFKLQSKSAVALVNERRIEFVRSKNHKSMATIDETTGQIVKDKKPSREKDVLVAEGEIERHLQWRHAKKIGPGLANLGNTCYLNSVLQCLCYTPSFAQYLLQKDVLARFGATTSGPSPSSNQNQHGNKFHKSHGTMMGKSHVAGGGQGFCGARVMARLLQSVHGGTARVLQPKELVMNIRHVSKNFRIGRQEDSHEFFRLLLDAMQRASLRKAHIKQEHSPAAATTFIHRLFSGKLKNTLTCAKCQFVSERLDDFMDLSLEINHGITSIKGAIKHFTATETLDDSNAWKCSRCQQRSRAEKGMTIDTCPNVLVVQLKRFDAMFGKIKKHIEFSTTLDLSLGMAKGCADRTRGRNKYELHAVLVHAGFSTNCGHYYAFVKGSSGQWYEMNDETVRWVSVETVLQQKAYMLFYSRVLPPGEQPSPREKAAAKEKPAEKKKASEEAAGEPVKPVAVNGTAAKPVEKLSMNGFLTSLRTDLDAPKKPVENGVKKPVENGVKVLVRPPTSSVVTYTVSVPVKHQGTRKRRLVPVFVGSVGRFARFQSSAKWTRAAPLEMTLLETSSKATAELPNGRKASTEETAATPPPQRVVEKLAFNPRELRGFGEKNSALYGRSVDQWVAPEDAQGVQSVLVETHERVLQKLKQEDWTHRRAQRKSSWDDELDAGKTKKLKKRKAFVANEGKANAFQLALVQKKQKHA